MKKSRRNFLKAGGASALGIGLTAAKAVNGSEASEQPAEPVQQKPLPASAKHWGMVIDTRQMHCVDELRPIMEACRKAHNVPSIDNPKHEIKWIWAEQFHNAFTDHSGKYQAEEVEHRSVPVLCNHCENPPCVRVCPTKATFKRPDGIVLMDFHRCIGCRFCMAGCPYGARSFNYKDPRPDIRQADYNPAFPTRTKGVVEKCNFCAELLAKGQKPACVAASNGAIAFGDLDDPESEVRQLLKTAFTVRRKPTLGTEPSVYYIIS